MLSTPEIEIQNIDHLGIVAGIIDAIGLVEIINELIGEEPGEKVMNQLFIVKIPHSATTSREGTIFS